VILNTAADWRRVAGRRRRFADDAAWSGTLSGALDGGAGNDVLNLTLTGASTIAGGIASFETINVAGGSTADAGRHDRPPGRRSTSTSS
jgi:hypothetical protein